MTGWVLRALAVADAPVILPVIQAAFRAQSAPTDPHSGALRETVESLGAQLAAGGGAGIEAEGRLVAVVLWVERDGALDLGRLAVLPGWRRRGLARALIGAAEGAARQRGLRRLTLGVRLALADNRRLFTSCGFVETGVAAHAGYAVPTSARMEKRLA